MLLCCCYCCCCCLPSCASMRTRTARANGHAAADVTADELHVLCSEGFAAFLRLCRPARPIPSWIAGPRRLPNCLTRKQPRGFCEIPRSPGPPPGIALHPELYHEFPHRPIFLHPRPPTNNSPPGPPCGP